jgi:hypothetical protein
MILAEFFGGIIGLLGEYPRSVRRVEQIRKRFAAETVSSLYEETLPELKGIIHSEKSAEKALK